MPKPEESSFELPEKPPVFGVNDESPEHEGKPEKKLGKKGRPKKPVAPPLAPPAEPPTTLETPPATKAPEVVDERPIEVRRTEALNAYLGRTKDGADFLQRVINMPGDEELRGKMKMEVADMTQFSGELYRKVLDFFVEFEAEKEAHSARELSQAGESFLSSGNIPAGCHEALRAIVHKDVVEKLGWAKKTKKTPAETKVPASPPSPPSVGSGAAEKPGAFSFRKLSVDEVLDGLVKGAPAPAHASPQVAEAMPAAETQKPASITEGEAAFLERVRARDSRLWNPPRESAPKAPPPSPPAPPTTEAEATPTPPAVETPPTPPTKEKFEMRWLSAHPLPPESAETASSSPPPVPTTETIPAAPPEAEAPPATPLSPEIPPATPSPVAESTPPAPVSPAPEGALEKAVEQKELTFDDLGKLGRISLSGLYFSAVVRDKSALTIVLSVHNDLREAMLAAISDKKKEEVEQEIATLGSRTEPEVRDAERVIVEIAREEQLKGGISLPPSVESIVASGLTPEKIQSLTWGNLFELDDDSLRVVVKASDQSSYSWGSRMINMSEPLISRVRACVGNRERFDWGLSSESKNPAEDEGRYRENTMWYAKNELLKILQREHPPQS